MGCSTSSPQINQYNAQLPTQTIKSTCLVFGMPDSGQEQFVSSIENCFSSISGKHELPFECVIASTDRSDRASWIDEFSNHKRVIVSFFFVNISSKSNVLCSIRTLNWLRCQLTDKNTLFPVALVKTDEDLQNFQYLKDVLGEGVDVSTFNDENQSDSRIYAEHIISYVANHPR